MAQSSSNGRSSAGARPVQSARYGRLRDSVLTVGAKLMAKTSRPLWYAESLVLSSRYQQWLSSNDWATGAKLRRDRLELWEKDAAPRLKGTDPVAFEFGVASGLATQWWAESGVRFAEWHGFDTFEGLPDDWARAGISVMAAGVFTPETGAGTTPQVDAPYEFHWHKGLIEDTLPEATRPTQPLFILIDVDLLAPTQTILAWLAEHGRSGDLIYFDEAFDPWNEGQAIRDASADGLKFRAHAYTGSSLLIELV